MRKMSFLALFACLLGASNSYAQVEVFVPGNDARALYDDLSLVGVSDATNPGRVEQGKMRGLFQLRYLGSASRERLITTEPEVILVNGRYVLEETSSSLDFFFSNPVTVNAKSPVLKLAGMRIEREQDTTLISLDSYFIGVGAFESRFEMTKFSGDSYGVSVDRALLELPNLGLEVPGRFLTQTSDSQNLIFGLGDTLRVEAPLSASDEGCFFQMGALESTADYDVSAKALIISPETGYNYLGSMKKWKEANGQTASTALRLKAVQFEGEKAKLIGHSQCYCVDLSPQSADQTCSSCTCN